MATKSKKVTRKKSTGRVSDLATRKDPKGGAQKKEGPMNSSVPIRTRKTRLA